MRSAARLEGMMAVQFGCSRKTCGYVGLWEREQERPAYCQRCGTRLNWTYADTFRPGGDLILRCWYEKRLRAIRRVRLSIRGSNICITFADRKRTNTRALEIRTDRIVVHYDGNWWEVPISRGYLESEREKLIEEKRRKDERAAAKKDSDVGKTVDNAQ